MASFLFFLSGFAALVYQVVWQRLLGIFSGVDVYATTITVAAFMAGLGCGSLAGGYVSDRLSARGNLRLFAVAELAVGVFGLLSATLFYDVLYLRFGDLAASTAATPVILFLSLLWPTFFMGMSLPLLACALTRDMGRAASTIGWLYGLNTLGAGLGAFLATWWLVPSYGLDGSLRVSAVLNVIVSLGAVPLSLAAGRAAGTEAGTEKTDVATDASPADISLSFPAWAAIYGLSGFLALSLEIVWFRVLGVIVKSTAFTFGTLLAVYLTGLGAGASIGSVFARRIRRPAFLFFMMQSALGVYVGLSMTELLRELASQPWFEWLRAHLSETSPIDLQRTLAEGRIELPLLYLAIPALLIGPPTVLMGASFPLLQKAAQNDPSRLGRHIGALMMANIVGSTFGAILTGWFGLRVLGSAGVLRTVVALSAAFALAALMASRGVALGRLRWGAAAVATAASIVVAAMPGAPRLWAALHGSVPGWLVFHEDETGLSVVKPSLTRIDPRSVVFVNGLSQSWLPYGGIHTALGALPAFIHPNPRDAAVIGLGSGDTVFALAARREIGRIACVEIVRTQLDTLQLYQKRFPYPGLQTLFADARIEHITADGRLYVMHAGRQFDIIEADALRPRSAYAGNLYSDRYFEVLRDRLRPGGLAVTWAPTPRVLRTFVKVFPHVVAYDDILMGSRDPIAIDLPAIRTRAYDPVVRAYYANAGVDIVELLEQYMGRPPEVFDQTYDRSTVGDVNTDLFPRDEFALPPLLGWLSGWN